MGSNPFPKNFFKKLLKRRRYSHLPVAKKHSSTNFSCFLTNKNSRPIRINFLSTNNILTPIKYNPLHHWLHHWLCTVLYRKYASMYMQVGICMYIYIYICMSICVRVDVYVFACIYVRVWVGCKTKTCKY